MSVIGDIINSYRNPKTEMQRQLDMGIQEPQTLFYAILYGVLNLIATFPKAVLASDEATPLVGIMAGLLIGYLFFLPIAFYCFAAVIHWILIRFKGQGAWNEARRALVWSALVTCPIVLIGGIISPINNVALSLLINSIVTVIFAWQVWRNFNVVEFARVTKTDDI